MENKYIFAVYANLATVSLLNSLNGLALKLKRDQHKKDSWDLDEVKDFVSAIFDKEKPAPYLESTVEHFFPWVKPVIEKVGFDKDHRQADELNDAYKSILTAFCEQLDEIRNFHTHHYHEPIKQIKLPFCVSCSINYIYDGAVNVIKKRFEADESKVIHLRRCKVVGKGKEKRVVLRTETDRFFYTLNSGENLTEKGTAFFLCLFLSRRYAYLFLDRLSGFKRRDEPNYRYTLEVFTALQSKPPVQRLRYQEDNNLNFAMDILNEVSKIPKELYDTLCPDYTKKYNDGYIDPDGEDAKDSPLRSRIRHHSRFEQLALRYLDKQEGFENIGFHTYLGSYSHKGYLKPTIDGIKDSRLINFRLQGFCKNIESELPEKLEDVLGVKSIDFTTGDRPDINDFKPYMVEAANPHYIVNGNNIGIKLLTNSKNEYPTITEKGAKMPEPNYWLSKYELPAMLFYTWLRKHNKNKDVCKLSVPDILRQYTLRQTAKEKKFPEDNSELMQRRIEKAIIWCETKLNEVKHVGESDAAFGKKQHKELRAGHIADILARDMLYLQPSLDGKKNKGKVTGSNFQALQRSIAYYGEYKERLNAIFTGAGLLNSQNKHPFLDKVNSRNYHSLIAFYRSYLNERKTYFEEQKKKLAMGKRNFQCHPLRDLQREEEKEIQPNSPVFLPRGLFDETIKDCLKKSPLSKVVASDRINVAYLIQQYFKEVCQDDVPDFYKQKRNYRFIDKEKVKINPPKQYLTLEERMAAVKRMKPKYIDPSEANEVHIFDVNDEEEKDKKEYLNRKAYNEVCDNESLIRLYQTQDMLLFLIAKECLPEEMGDKITEFKLQNVKGILDTSVSFTVSVGTVTVKAENVKIKDYGKVFAIKQDARFVSLVNELHKKKPGKKTFTYEQYKTENDEFEKYRLGTTEKDYLNGITALCHKFEKLMVKTFPDVRKEAEGFYNFSTLVDEYRTRTGQIDEDDAKFIAITRNMFMHDSYKKECIDKVYPTKEDIKDNQLGYAKEIGDKFKKKMQEMIATLGKRE